MTDIDGLLRRAGISALKSLLRKAVDNHRFAQMQADLRPVMPVRTATRLLHQLPPHELAGLKSYLESPDFEQVMLHVMVGLTRPKQAVEDDPVREELRHGLRLHVGLSEENGYALTELVFDAIIAAVDRSGAPLAVQGKSIAALAHRATLAVRNSELLHLVPSLTAFHEQADGMRGQVAKLHRELRLPHAGVSRSTPWSELYVMPELEGFSIDELTEPGQRSVILGDPGAGKSTLARWLSYQIAVDDRPRVPFLVILRDLSESLRAGERSLEEYLPGVARNPYNVPLTAETVEYLLLNGRAVVLLDGLDELTDLSLRQRVVDLVDGFAAYHPLVPIVVTARKIGYSHVALGSEFRTCTIVPFSDEQVAAYATNWFALDDGTPQPERASLCDAFIRDSTAIRELRSNPLLLALLCATYRTERHIPRNRAQVYERCALMLFEQWDSMRGIRMPVRFEGKVRGAVQELAWQMYAEQQSATLTRSKALATIARFLQGKGIDEDLARQLAADFLEFCAGRAWVLAEVGAVHAEPTYGFAHKTFMEFFAAEHLVRRQGLPEKVWNILATKRLEDSSWTVVGQIAVHLLERNIDDGAERFVVAALNNPGADPARRFTTADFLAQICSELPLPLRAVKGIVRLAYDQATAVPLRERAPIVQIDQKSGLPGDSALELLEHSDTDGPNAQELAEQLAKVFGEAILAQNDVACYLVEWLLHDVRRTSMSDEFLKRLSAEHADARQRWRQGNLAFHAFRDSWGIDVDETVRLAGVAPFYVGGRYAGISLLPRAPAMERGEVSKFTIQLRDLLMRADVPWLPADYSADLIAEKSPEKRFVNWKISVDMDVATKMIFLLPYVEAMARNGDFPWRNLARTLPRSLVLVRRGSLDWAETPWALPLPGSEARCVEFIRRWAAGEFSLLH